VTLVVGLGTSCVAATLVAVTLDLTNLMPSDFVLNGSALGGLTTVDAATVGVAFARESPASSPSRRARARRSAWPSP
jgi:hypothetical protein